MVRINVAQFARECRCRKVLDRDAVFIHVGRGVTCTKPVAIQRVDWVPGRINTQTSPKKCESNQMLRTWYYIEVDAWVLMFGGYVKARKSYVLELLLLGSILF